MTKNSHNLFAENLKQLTNLTELSIDLDSKLYCREKFFESLVKMKNLGKLSIVDEADDEDYISF